MPIAASAMSQSTPPCSVPIGLACAAVAWNSITASPGLTEIRSKPISRAIGGGGASPRAMAALWLSIFVITTSRNKIYIGVVPRRREHVLLLRAVLDFSHTDLDQ